MIPQEALKELGEIHSTQELNDKIDELNKGIAALTAKVADAEKSRADMKTAMDRMDAAASQMQDLQTKMEALKAAIPEAFAQAEQNYLAEIDAKAMELEGAFQNTLNGGFSKVYLTSAIASLLALLMLAFYANKVAVTAEAPQVSGD
jgi:chaperonin cofactor prefoldin